MGLCGLVFKWLALSIVSIIPRSSAGMVSKLCSTGDATLISGFMSTCGSESLGLLLIG